MGLAFVMGVIAVALLVLICTRKKASSSSFSRQKADEKAAARALAPLDQEPKVVVVFMPGGDHARRPSSPAPSRSAVTARRQCRQQGRRRDRVYPTECRRAGNAFH